MMDLGDLDYTRHPTTTRHACQESEMTGGDLRKATGGLNDQESAIEFVKFLVQDFSGSRNASRNEE